MISVTLNGKLLQMQPNSRFAFELNNPAFDDTIIQGDMALPMTVPYKGNAKTFGFSHQMLLKNRITSYNNSAVRYKGAKLYSSICDVLSYEDEQVNISHRLNISSLKCMSKKLKDLNWEEQSIGETQTDILSFANDVATHTYPYSGINFPMIKNSNFYGTKNPDFEGWINNFEQSTGFYENVTTNRNTLVPMLYLMKILYQGFNYDGYSIMDVGFAADPIQQRLMVYNNYAIDKITDNSSPSNGMKSRCETAPQFDQFSEDTVVYDNDSTDGNYDALTAYDNSNGRYTIAGTGIHIVKVRNKFIFTHGSPAGSTDTINIRLYKNGTVLHTETMTISQEPAMDISFTHSFVAVGGDVGQELYTTVTYANSHNPSIKVILISPYNYFSVNDNYVASTNLNVYNGILKLANHVPDVTFGQLLNAIKKTFNLVFKFDHLNKSVSILYFDEIRSQAVKQLNKRSIVGHTVRIDSSVKYKNFNYTWPGDDELLSDNFIPFDQELYIGEFDSTFALNTLAPGSTSLVGRFALVKNLNQIWRCTNMGAFFQWKYYTDAWYNEEVFPDGTIEHRAECAPLMMWQENLGPDIYQYQVFPHIEQTGSSNEFDLGIHISNSLRLFYWQGDNSTTYPFSTSVNYANGASLLTIFSAQIDPMSLMWKPSLRPMLWQKRIDMFSKGQWIEKKIQPTLPDLMNLDYNDYLRVDNANFYIKQVRGELGDNIHELIFTMLQE